MLQSIDAFLTVQTWPSMCLFSTSEWNQTSFSSSSGAAGNQRFRITRPSAAVSEHFKLGGSLTARPHFTSADVPVVKDQQRHVEAPAERKPPPPLTCNTCLKVMTTRTPSTQSQQHPPGLSAEMLADVMMPQILDLSTCHTHFWLGKQTLCAWLGAYELQQGWTEADFKLSMLARPRQMHGHTQTTTMTHAYSLPHGPPRTKSGGKWPVFFGSFSTPEDLVL